MIRDLPTTIVLSLAITIFGVNWRKPRESGSLNRFEGFLWLSVFVVYTAFVIYSETH